MSCSITGQSEIRNPKSAMGSRWSAALCALLAIIAMAAASGPALARGGQGPGPRARAKINLSPEQRERIDKHLRESRQNMFQARRELREARIHLYGQLAEYRLDDRKVQDAVRKINGLQLRLLKLNLESQTRLRDVLTREQFEELREAIGDRTLHHGDAWVWPGGPGMDAPDVRRLDLLPEQQEQIKRLWRSSRETTASVVGRLKDDAQALHRLYMSYDLDPKQANARIDSLSESQLALLKATIARQTELRHILTEQQFRALAKTVRPFGKWRRGPGHGPRRPKQGE